MYVRDHGVHSEHQLLGAVGDLDQEESSLKTQDVPITREKEFTFGTRAPD